MYIIICCFRGWRPSYRNVLLDVRKLLNIRCSAKLSTEDLEAEIFLHLLQEYSRYIKGATDLSFDALFDSKFNVF